MSNNEKDCGVPHYSMLEAIRHAEERLGFRNLPLQPYWGTTPFNLGKIVGFQLNNQKRWRLDYDPVKGIHVNEENYEAPPSKQKVVHRVIGVGMLTGDQQIRLQWAKWTSGAVDLPDKVKEELELQKKSHGK